MTEITAEVTERARRVVNDIQVQQLSGILDLLEELLSDPQKPCYVVIDQLDEPWADNDVRFRLLKGLIDTVREFGKVHNAKVIIALRVDLLDQTFKVTRSDAGFQEDKYRSLNLPLRWSRDQLISLLNKRVALLVRDAYTNYVPQLIDVIPEKINFGRKKVNTIDYILERTWWRPRDLITFFNACIHASEGRALISKQAILDAEGEYSRLMLRAIASEWYAQFPNLPDAIKALLTNRPPQFKLDAITKLELDDWSLQVACNEGVEGQVKQLALEYQSDKLTIEGFRREIASVFFKTGCVGLKPSAASAMSWANSESYFVSPAEIDDTTSVRIHPGLWRVLGVKPD